jgi:glucosamine 6-phosphate synthetase-like amidotransferase/phosphosugar isomerase protein
MIEAIPTEQPELRSGPPWVMEDMIAAETELGRPVVEAARAEADLVRAIRDVAGGGRVAVVGCGTSEHGAMAVAEQLDEALRAVGARPGTAVARQAFEAAQAPWSDGVCLGVSHEGHTAATIAAMAAAADAGAAVGLITAVPRSPAGEAAAHVLTTPKVDRSWCHTVGYLSPILAGGALGGEVRETPIDAGALAADLEGASRAAEAADRIAEALHGVRRVVAVGSGIDGIAARELALKLEEGARLPAVGMDLETLLHGHLVSCDASTGAVVVATDPRDSHRRSGRAAQALAACRRIEMRTAAIASQHAQAAWDPDLTDAGRLIVPAGAGIDPLLAALTGTAFALQALTVGLVHRAGTNPDLIRREEERYREAAAVTESSFPRKEG